MERAMSSYDNRFGGGLSVGRIPVLNSYSGTVRWVDSSGGSNGDGSFKRPFATIDAAVSACNANKGDIVMVKAGHAETISTAAILVLDVAGVTIIGLGRGAMRPTLTFTAAAATIPVSAASVALKNLLFVANFADVASFITIAAAPSFSVDGCEFRDTDSTHNALTCVTTTVTVNADGFEFTNNRVFSSGTTAATTMIVIAGTMSRCTINDNFYVGAVLNNTAALLEHGALNVTNLEMARNKVYRPNTDTATGAVLIKTTATANTGVVYDNYVGCLDIAGVILLTVGSDYAPFNNYVTGEVDKSGWLIPAAGTDA